VEVLVVVDPCSDLESAAEHGEETRWQWELVGAPGGVFHWNIRLWRFELREGDEHAGDGVLFALVQGSEKF